MIWKAAATAGAVLPAAAAAIVRTPGATTSTSIPVVWSVLGYSFEAGSMIAGICACTAVRFYVVQTDRAVHRWTIDLPVSALTVMFTAAAIVARRPGPLEALATGTGIGALGVGIITLALGWVRRNFPSFDDKPSA